MVLVTVRTEIFDWLRIKARQSNAFLELTRLPKETKPTITFLNCAVFPGMLLPRMFPALGKAAGIAAWPLTL